MDGIYFEQGINAARAASNWEDAERLCPHGRHGLEADRRRVWMNGFLHGFNKPRAITSRLLRAQTLSGTIAVEA